MRKLISLFLSFSVIVSWSGFLQAAEDLEAFQGRWKVIKLVESGVSLPQDMIEESLHSGGKFSIIEDRIVFRSILDGRQYQKQLVLDSKKQPAELTVVFEDKPTGWGIYRFEGDSLIVCMSAKSARNRPEDFTSARDSENLLLVLRKEGPALRPEKKPSPPKTSSEPRKDTEPESEVVEYEPIDREKRGPTDQEIADKLFGTWLVPSATNTGPLLVSLNVNGSFTVTQDIPSAQLFGAIFWRAPVSSGRWTVTNGFLRLQILNSVNSSKRNQMMEFAIRNLTRTDLVIFNAFGTGLHAKRR